MVMPGVTLERKFLFCCVSEILETKLQTLFLKNHLIFRFVWRLFVPDPRERVTDAPGDVRTFITEFESKHGQNHPNFYSVSLSVNSFSCFCELQFKIFVIISLTAAWFFIIYPPL